MPIEIIVFGYQFVFWAVPKAVVLFALYFVIRKAVKDALRSGSK